MGTRAKAGTSLEALVKLAMPAFEGSRAAMSENRAEQSRSFRTGSLEC